MALNYRKDIDGIRAIAVLAVILFHAFPTIIQGGYIGVDIFFVISGFLISSIIFHQIANKQFSWTTFYIQRINRIVPALTLILLSALIGGYFLLFADEYQNLSKHILGSTFFLNNFMLWKESGYFDTSSDFKPLLHLWSLGIEEQFYLIWPLFIILIWSQKSKPIIAIIFIIALSFIINILGSTHHAISTFYLPMSRFWELGIGGVIAYTSTFALPSLEIHVHSIRFYPLLLNVSSILCLSVLLGAVFYFKTNMIYPGWAALLPTLCTAVLLCTNTSWVNQKILSKPGLTLVGIISYPLYLWHWELLSFAHIIYSGTLPYLLTVVLLAISFCCAVATYQFIEKPIRFSLKGKKYAPLTAKISALCLLSIGCLAFMIYSQQGLESRTLAQEKKSFTDELNSFEHFKSQVHPCEVSNQKAKTLGWCLQTKEGIPNKVIWGDSHADHLLPGLSKYATNDNWLLLGQSSCPPLSGVKGFWVGFKDTCANANSIALQTIIDNPAIDTVILASLGPFYISDTGYAAQHLGQYAPSAFVLEEAKSTDRSKNKADIFYDGLNRTINILQGAGKKVVLFQDVPELPFMPTRCFKRPLAPYKPCFLAKNEVLKRQKDYQYLLAKLQKSHPGVLLFNPLEYMCNQQSCFLSYKQHVLYRDSHHLSVTGSHFIGKKLLAWIGQQPQVA